MVFVVEGIFRDTSSSAERYDPVIDTWTHDAPISTGRFGDALCAMSGQLYVSGVWKSDTDLATVERYTPSTDTWTPVAAMPSNRDLQCARAVDGLMYDVGDYEGDYNTTLNTMVSYTPETNSWIAMVSMPAVRSGSGACVVGQHIFVIGGRKEFDGLSSTVYRYNVETNHCDTLVPFPEAVCGPDGMIYAAGGQSESNRVPSSIYAQV